MTVAELMEELAAYPSDAEAVVIGHSWSGTGEVESFVSEPFLTQETTDEDKLRVVIST